MKRYTVDELIKGKDGLEWKARLWLIVGSIGIAALMHAALWVRAW